MVRFIMKRSFKGLNGSPIEQLYTIDVDAPELERRLNSREFSGNHYDYQELLGVEVLGSLDSYDECVYSDDGTVTPFNSRKETE